MARVLRLFGILLAFSLRSAAWAGELPARPPSDTPPFSKAGQAELARARKTLVAEDATVGIVTLVAQHGKIVDVGVDGLANAATGAPLKRDDIFRIASMTKPIIGVAMMMLYEEGKWKLDDPVSKFIPAFKSMTVINADGTTEPAKSAITMRELMSHSGGLTYGLFGKSPADSAYLDAHLLDAASLADFATKLAKLPLKWQPGTAWEYSLSVDLQGYLVEKLSGQKLDQFLSTRIFKKLGMTDTAFFVPPEKQSRLVALEARGADGKLAATTPEKAASWYYDHDKPPALPSGGHGLYGTADDYARFAQMLLNRGELDGVRLLKPETVSLMMTNALPTGVTPKVLPAGTGFGLDLAVAQDPAAAHDPWGPGTSYWMGIFGTFFWIDPANDLIAVGMIQQTPASARTGQNVRTEMIKAVYEAMAE
jgi:CubicO group peptidase (beta-lactamase class C family)